MRRERIVLKSRMLKCGGKSLEVILSFNFSIWGSRRQDLPSGIPDWGNIEAERRKLSGEEEDDTEGSSKPYLSGTDPCVRSGNSYCLRADAYSVMTMKEMLKRIWAFLWNWKYVIPTVIFVAVVIAYMIWNMTHAEPSFLF